MTHSTYGLNLPVAGKTVRSSLARAIFERLRDEHQVKSTVVYKSVGSL